MKNSIFYTAVVCKDLETSIDFYTNALGFTVKKRVESKELNYSGAYIKDDKNDATIFLVSTDAINDTHFIGIQTDNLQGMYDSHNKAGYNTINYRKELDGFYIVKDPDGNLIEIVAPAED